VSKLFQVAVYLALLVAFAATLRAIHAPDRRPCFEAIPPGQLCNLKGYR
jgi:hypothetical protein